MIAAFLPDLQTLAMKRIEQLRFQFDARTGEETAASESSANTIQKDCMSDFFPVAKVGAVPEGEGRAFAVEGRMVGVFLVEGEYFAINDLCPHMGASLSSGHVEGHAVTCPWHAWRYCVKDGTWLDNPRSRTDSYPVRVNRDMIEVQVPAKESPGASGNDPCGN